MEEREEKVKKPTHRHTHPLFLPRSVRGSYSQPGTDRQTDTRHTHARERREMQSARVLAGLDWAGTGGPAGWAGGLLAAAQRQKAAGGL